jgi:hypothetical protein
MIAFGRPGRFGANREAGARTGGRAIVNLSAQAPSDQPDDRPQALLEGRG